MRYPDDLCTAHRRSLTIGSAISPEVMKSRGYRTVTVKAELHRLGFSEKQLRVPSLLLPLWGVRKEVIGYQSRPEDPRSLNGKSVKYETPSGMKMVLDIHPFAHTELADPEIPLFIAEGIKKGDALVSRGCCAVSLLGVWNWRGTNGLGGKAALPDWEVIALNGRKVYIIFDSDVMLKREVHTALARLKAFLESRGADVFVVYLPPGPGALKQGVDDYFAVGKSLEDLLALASSDLRHLPEGEKEGVPLPQYRATNAGLIWDKHTREGTIAVPLTNFVARIVGDTVEDDGVETRRIFEIQASVRHKTSRFTIPAHQFPGMSWPAEHLGASAILSPGYNIREHTRVAIQVLSGQVEDRVTYTHLGWREVDGRWVYLHAGGAIGPIQRPDYQPQSQESVQHVDDKTAHPKLDYGASGPIGPISRHIQARLTGPLGAYVLPLPLPPQGLEQILAIRASLRQLEVAPDVVSVPTLSATYRAVLGGADFSLHLAGETGFGKSELAALCQQHYGPFLNSRNLPAAWSSTDNALEEMAFLAKDALLVIDDFAPVGTSFEVQQMHRKADRVLRAQGNLSSRQRLRPDASLRPAKPPRGLILSTGEDVPKGQSLRARLLVVEVGPNDVDWEQLIRCQRDAAEGLYAQALAGFIQWLAPRYSEVKGKLRSEIVDLREKAVASASHRRTPEVMASLAMGLKYLVDYSIDTAALSNEEGRALWERGWKALGEAASRQSQFQSGSEPTKRFRDLLTASIASGRAHVAGIEGNSPYNAQAWGWRQSYVGFGDFDQEEWRPQGRCVGWIEGEDLYLEPEASYAAAQNIGKETDDPLVVAPKTLHKRLLDRGLLKSTDKASGHLTVRRTLQGARRRVLHLASTILEKSVQSVQPYFQRPDLDLAKGPNGEFIWPDSPERGSETGQEIGPIQDVAEEQGSETILTRLDKLGVQMTVRDERLRLEQSSNVPCVLPGELRELSPKILEASNLSRRILEWAGDDVKKWQRLHKAILHLPRPDLERLGPRDVLVTWAAAWLGKTRAKQDLTLLRRHRFLTPRQRNAKGGRLADINFWSRLATRQIQSVPIALAEDILAQKVFSRLAREGSTSQKS